MNLRELTAVITGSSSGIGLGMAEAFAAAGYRLVINGIATTEQAESLSQRLRQQHRAQVLFHHADLTDSEQCAQLIRDAEEHFGSVDILINNAGIQHVAATERFPVDRWNAILAVNLSSAFHTIRTALPGMQRRNYGRIINTASVHGLVASIHKAAYVAAKHGLIGLTKVVALENAERSITCNAICPGFVLTPLVQKQIDDRAAERQISGDEATRQMLQEKEPSRCFTSVDDIAAMALFLCSPRGLEHHRCLIPHGWRVDRPVICARHDRRNQRFGFGIRRLRRIQRMSRVNVNGWQEIHTRNSTNVQKIRIPSVRLCLRYSPLSLPIP
jgi:3-hydroxybutyrate dehydrogenase